MSNKVKYGLKNVYYAVATIDASTNTATYTTPVAWPGAVSLSLDAHDSQTKFRADNIDYWVGNANNGYEGDFTSALVPDSFKKDILGYVEDANGVLVEAADVQSNAFALIFQFEGDVKATRHVLYNCTATRPSVAGQTTEENTKPQTEALTITAIPIHNASLNKDIVKASRTNAGNSDSVYSGWFTSVYQATASTT